MSKVINQMIRARKKLGITQKELADMVGIKQQQMSRIESGGTYPTLATIEKIADKLGYDIVAQWRGELVVQGQEPVAPDE